MKFDTGSTAITREELDTVLNAIEIDAASGPAELRVVGVAPDLHSPLRITDAAILALSAQSVALAALLRDRSGIETKAEVDAAQVVYNLKPFVHLKKPDLPPASFANLVAVSPCNGYYATADGRTVYMANLVAKLRNQTLGFLGASPERSAVAAKIAEWQADDLEQAMTAQGIPIAVVRDADEWRSTDAGSALAETGIVHVETISRSPAVPLAPASRPLEGIRVLDMTHVVAGPMITRGLAEYGAEVLHLVTERPELQDPVTVTHEFRLGKRTAAFDLAEAGARDQFADLLREADVFVHSWRPGVLERFGFCPKKIAQINPGIVQVSVSCYGPVGPWAARGGFDGLALASTGATALEARHDRHKLSPPGVLTDALVGFLGTAVTAALLRRRAREGGAYRAELSLARIAMWLQDLGTRPVSLPAPEPATPAMRTLAGPAGPIEYVAPAMSLSAAPGTFEVHEELTQPEWQPRVARQI